jgi:NADPH:quinone reductase-like Zn-dependent oxidoreductase
MKAAVHNSYGPPDVVRIAEVEKPAAKDNQVLVKVHATTVNRTDCGMRAARPFFIRLFAGLVRQFQELLASGAFRPLVDRTYPLDEIVEAYRYVETGQKLGSVVISVRPPDR